jgi:hypothetical protein
MSVPRFIAHYKYSPSLDMQRLRLTDLEVHVSVLLMQ